MRYKKTIILALLFVMVMLLSLAAVGDTTKVYTQEQVNEIVANEVVMKYISINRPIFHPIDLLKGEVITLTH